jgi:hypothetical protein
MARLRPFRLLLAILAIATLYILLLKSQSEHILTRLNQLDIEVERRLLWWDWTSTPEELLCGNPSPSSSTKPPIPNIVHYIILSPTSEPAEIPFFAYLSMRTTILRLQPTKIILHSYSLNTSNPYYQLLSPYLTLQIHDKTTLRGPDNKSLDAFALAHQADFLRLSILESQGGIYLDTDVYPLRSFSHLLHSPRDVIMAHEGGNRYGLGNAVILARPNSEFIRHWRETYNNGRFNEKNWNEHSILMPKRLQKQFPEEICPLSPGVFFWPTWAKVHLDMMFEELEGNGREVQELRANMTRFGGAMYEGQLALHLRTSHLNSEEDVLGRENRFNVLVREGLETPLP